MIFTSDAPIGAARGMLSKEDGAALVELALSLPILALLVVLATDYGLERLAESQLQTATIAATEYAANKGCISTGIASAASKSVATSFNKVLFSNLTVTSSPFCACGFSSGALVVTGTNSPACSGVANVCDGDVPAPAYVRISVSGIYHPVAPNFWSGNAVIITNGAVVRTFGNTSNCSG